MVAVTEVPVPDFGAIIANAGDEEMIKALYESAVPEQFESLTDPKILSLSVIRRPLVTGVRAAISGEIDDARFVHEHIFVVPDPGIGPDGVPLLVLVACLDYHATWMRQICNQIFEGLFSEC
jgi:hypothetical protein